FTGRREGHGRQDDLVTLLKTNRRQRQMKCSRAGAQCHSIAGAYVPSKCSFKLSHLITGCKPTTAQYPNDGLDILFVDRGPMERQKLNLCYGHGLLQRSAILIVPMRVLLNRSL